MGDSGKSGEHRLKLASIGSPVSASLPPDAPTPPKGVLSPHLQLDIDPAKLLAAWEASVEVQRELIRVVEKAEADNRLTRRLVFAVMLAAAALMMAAGGVSFRRGGVVLALAESTHEDVRETLKALRSMTKAHGAQVEAERALTPQADERALEAAVEAQATALDAERKVTADPTARAKAAAELHQVQQRLIKIKAEAPALDPARD